MQCFLETSRQRGAVCILFVLALLLAAPAMADPAGRIGRIAWLSGPVQLQNAGSPATEAAVLNRPLTSGDVLSTSAGGRAEIHIGSLKLQVDSGSVLALEQIDDERIRLRLDDGSVIVRLPSRDTARDFELNTRDGRFSALDAGHYRFDFDGASSAVTAYSGRLHFDAEDSALDVSGGQRAQFWNAGGTRYRLSAPADDSFANWSYTRDQTRTGETYTRHVSPEMTGAGDLDAYGTWAETAEYGAVWYPRAVAADWAPYRSGHWVWIAPWGWNWVGDEPWGFAPFHYGRWVLHRQAWGWVPGVRIARPVYAPAMVAWVGTANFSIAIASRTAPTVGWFPLAPREVYVPAYRSSPTYVRQVNITHVTNITNLTTIVNNPQTVVEQTRYRHRNEPRAVTMVAADVVRDHRPVAAAAIAHNERSVIGQNPLRAEAPVAAPVAAVSTPVRREPDHERRGVGRSHEVLDKTAPMPASVAMPSGSNSASAAAAAAERPTPSTAGQRAAEIPLARESAARVATPAPAALPPPSAGRSEPVTVPRVQPAAVPEPRLAAKPAPMPVSAPLPAPVAVDMAQRSQPVRPDMTPRPQPEAQAVRQAPVVRIDPAPQRAREVREERREISREAPRELRQNSPQPVPHEVSRTPESRTEVHREQHEERKEERRHPSRDEKPASDSGRPQENSRQR